MTKVIFLDIDGVLNSERNNLKQRRPRPFDPEAVSALNTVLQETGAKIVLSSAWRIGMSVAQIEEMLTLEGLPPGRVLDKTEWLHDETDKIEIPLNELMVGDFKGPQYMYRSAPRRDEIALWLSQHPEVTSWVAIDDDPDAGPQNLVLCDAWVGFTAEGAREALRILRG